MKLHKDKKLFDQAIRATAEHKGIQEIYVEKDYWVTLALKTIFESDCKEYAVFKGGTALSKCYKVIERFSEDIDLVILKTKGESDNVLKARIRSISKKVEEVLPEVNRDGITNKRGKIRKTAHDYDKIFKGDYGQVRDFVVIEATVFGNFEPYHGMEISSMVYEMMEERGQQEIAEAQGLLPFPIQVLDIKRTICEKIMSLVRFSYEEDPIDSLRKKIRHTYDIHQLLKIPEVAAFFESQEFDEMLIKVGQDDVDSFRNNNDWLPNHPSESLMFKNIEDTWSKLIDTYRGQFADLVYGELPNPDEILADLKRVSDRMKHVDWNINLDQ